MLDPLLQPDRLGPHPCHCVVHQGYHSQGVRGSSIQTLTSARESDFLAVGPLSHLHKWKKKGSDLSLLGHLCNLSHKVACPRLGLQVCWITCRGTRACANIFTGDNSHRNIFHCIMLLTLPTYCVGTEPDDLIGSLRFNLNEVDQSKRADILP